MICYVVINSSGFGKVFVGLNKVSKELVAIKRMKSQCNSEWIEKESRLLKGCVSRYIVRYYDLIQSDGETFVHPECKRES